MRPEGRSFRARVFFVLMVFGVSFTILHAGTPHLGYGTLRYSDGSAPSSVSFTAYIVSRPGNVLVQSSFDCGYENGIWFVQCGNFSTSWKAGDILHVNFNDVSARTGSVEITLTNEPGDDAGYTFLTSSTDQVKLSLPDLTIMRGVTVDIPIYMQGLTVADSVLAYQLTVGFDSEVLLAVGATSSGTMTQQWGAPLSAPGENQIQLGSFTTNQPPKRLVADGGILVKVTFVVQGIPSSQTSSSTILRFLGAKVFTKNKNYVISHTKCGALTVNENPTVVTKVLDIYTNWNLVSLSIVPNPNTLPEVFGGLPIEYVFGYLPSEGPMSWDVRRPTFLNDLTILEGLHGYWIKSTSATMKTWSVSGNSILVTTPIPMGRGWNLIGYLPLIADSISHAFQSLGTVYTFVMGFGGGSVGPMSWDRNRPSFLNTLNRLTPLSGYWVKMDNAATLIYPTSGYRKSEICSETSKFKAKNDTVPIVTPWWCDFWGVQPDILKKGDVIDVYDSDGIICGRDTVIAEGGFLVHVFGDDSGTEDVDEGAVEGEPMHFTINGDPAVVVNGDSTWTDKESKEIELAFASTIVIPCPDAERPRKFGLEQNYPNPFNAYTRIRYSLPGQCHVSIRIMDAIGREIRTLVESGIQKAGDYTCIWDGKNNDGEYVSTGIYMYQLRAGDIRLTKKMIILF